MELPIFGIFILVAIAMIGLSVAANIRRQQTWEKVAERLELHFSSDEIHGRLSDVSLRVWTEVRGSGKQRSTYTLLTASLDGKPPAGLLLAPEGFFKKLGKLVGMDDIELGLNGIDEKLVVRANDESEVRKWAQRSDVSRALIDLIELRAQFEVTAHQIELQFNGALDDPDRIEFLIEQLIRIARALSGRGYGALLDDGQW